jgi:serine/threonine protein kinase
MILDCLRHAAVALQSYFNSSLGLAGPADFERIRLIGQGDVGKVYLVRLRGSKHLFAMKVLSKQEMIARNKVESCLSFFCVVYD